MAADHLSDPLVPPPDLPTLQDSQPAFRAPEVAALSTPAYMPPAAAPEIVPNGIPKHRKLHGRAFYESLKSPRYILAPMVDQSEFAWRLLSRDFLPPDLRQSLICYSPMLHARIFANTAHYRANSFEPEKTGLPAKPLESDEKWQAKIAGDAGWLRDGNPELDRPLFVQFCSNKPEEFLEAARHVAPYVDAVDLNLGCPQGIAKKGHYGSFLQEEPDLIYNLINQLHCELPVPVTAKMRILETKEKTLEYATKLLEAGASVITVHGRRREQKGHLTGLADWSYIRYLRENLPKGTVIFANGNCLTHEDLASCLEATGADAVMSAEGNLSDPAIFAGPPPTDGADNGSREYWVGRDGKGGYRMDAVIRRYLDIIWRHVLLKEPPAREPLWTLGEPLPSWYDAEDEAQEAAPPAKRQKTENKGGRKSMGPNISAMQPHFFHMLRPLVTAKTHIRDRLAKARPGDLEGYEQILRMIEKVTIEGIKEYAAEEPATEGKDETVSDAFDESSHAAIKRCKRPWFVCQPHIRPLPHEAMEKGALTMSKKDKKRLLADQKIAEEVGVAPDGAIGKEVEGDAKGGKGDTVEVAKEGLVCG